MPKKPQPFSDEWYKSFKVSFYSDKPFYVSKNHVEGLFRYIDTTITAQNKQIEELEMAKHLRGERRRSTIGNLKAKIATQTAAIKRLKQGIEKFGDIFVGCYECKKKVQREIKMIEEFLAAAKKEE